jgi:hypothetical protein
MTFLFKIGSCSLSRSICPLRSPQKAEVMDNHIKGDRTLRIGKIAEFQLKIWYIFFETGYVYVFNDKYNMNVC